MPIRRFGWLWLLLIVPTAAAEPSAHDRHVVFENSADQEAYFHSHGTVIAPSELELVRNKFPVLNGKFVSPPSSLRLKWKSGFGGDWRLTLQVPGRVVPGPGLAGDTLTFWCFTDQELSFSDLPRITVDDSRGNSIPDVTLLATIERVPANEWVRLEFPLARPAAEEVDEEARFDPHKLARIIFSQRLDDERSHTIYIDDVRIVDRAGLDNEPPSTLQNVTAAGFDRHVELSWEPGREPDLCNYRVYRSSDGENFEPLGTRPGHFHRYVDFVGASDKSHSYQITAVDLGNNESPHSASAAATTRIFDDAELLEMVQHGCFRYYWDAANRDTGMALEAVPGDDNLVAVGASGFGIMAILVGTERQFITRDESVERMLKIVRFLKTADRFHGVFPHFIDGRTGRVVPLFDKLDDGGDLVETAFLMQGLLAARQYYRADSPKEREIRDSITALWHDVQWDWYRKDSDANFLHWHWSPNYGWRVAHPLIGFNETMIAYLLAIASPTHPVPVSLYYTGWAGQSEYAVNYRRGWSRTTQGDHYTNGNTYYGYKLDVGCGRGGDMFFTQFSFLGFDPRGIRDPFTNYFHNSRQLALINRAYCIDNPRRHVGYGPDCWGISAGVNSGGGKPQPRADNGTICCSAALGSFPYTPDESMAALRHFYRNLGEKIWGEFGFHDGFNQTEGWYDEVYMGLNQAQIVVMIENHRSGLPWQLFMANPEIRPMLERIGFVSDDASVPDAEQTGSIFPKFAPASGDGNAHERIQYVE